MTQSEAFAQSDAVKTRPQLRAPQTVIPYANRQQIAFPRDPDFNFRRVSVPDRVRHPFLYDPVQRILFVACELERSRVLPIINLYGSRQMKIGDQVFERLVQRTRPVGAP